MAVSDLSLEHRGNHGRRTSGPGTKVDPFERRLAVLTV
jgi:hypothetical protein